MYKALEKIYLRLIVLSRAVFGRLAASRGAGGQGTVEYVGLILLVALMMLGVLAVLKGANISEGKELGELIVKKIKDAIEQVQF